MGGRKRKKNDKFLSFLSAVDFGSEKIESDIVRIVEYFKKIDSIDVEDVECKSEFHPPGAPELKLKLRKDSVNAHGKQLTEVRSSVNINEETGFFEVPIILNKGKK